MKMIIPVIMIAMIFVVLNLVSAQVEPTQQFNKIFLDPFYRESMDNDISYEYNLTVNPPDKISAVKSAIITFSVWHNPTIRYTLTVNGQPCNNPSFLVHTSYENAGNNEIYFDCSNVIKRSGIYTLLLTPDDDTGTITGWLDLTYMNRPKGILTIHGTEYQAGQDAKVWLQLLDANNNDIINGFCLVDIISPDNQVNYIDDATMVNLENNGVYVYDFIAPRQQGVYPVLALCYYNASQNKYYANSSSMIIGTTSGSLSDTVSIDSATYDLKEAQYGGSKRLNANFTFSNFCSNYSEDLLTGVTLSTYSRWASTYPNDDLTFHYYNYVNNTWVALPNKFKSGISGYLTISNSLNMNNLTTYGFMSNDGTVSIKINDTNLSESSTDTFYIDELYVSCNELSSEEWQSVKGSSEIHVSSDKSYVTYLVSGNLTNETYMNNFYLDYLVASDVTLDRNDEEIELEMFSAFPCHHITNLSLQNSSGSYVEQNFTTQLGDEGRCLVRYNQDLKIQTNYNVRITAENFWKLELNALLSEAKLNNDIITIGCVNYQTANGLPSFDIPLVYAPQIDNLYDACSEYFEAFYYFNKTMTEIFNFETGNFTSGQMTSLESSYEYLKEAGEETKRLGDVITQGWLLADSYSLAILNDPFPPTNPNYTLYFSQITTSYYQYLKSSNLSNEVWNAPARTLTNFNFTVDANNTAIAETIWNYDGTISNNLISQITTAVWNWTNNIASSILTQISDTIWTRTDRNLTYYETVDINYTQIKEDVWDYENRTLSVGSGSVGGTEYSIDEETGRIVARILDGGGNPVNNANCTAYIYYPANTSIYLTLQMSSGNQTQVEGVYYVDFNHSGLIGVHAYMIDCYKGGQDFYLLGSYHVFETNRTKIAEEVWYYPSRNLTFYNNTDLTNYTKIAEDIWTYTTRNLTFYETNNITVADIWDYVNRTLTDYNQTAQVDLTDYNRIQQLVWNATDRNLTYYEVTEINETEIAVEVWQYSDRNLTYYASTLSAEDIWNYTDRNLTYYETTAIDYNQIQDLVWNATIRTLTDFNFTVDVNETEISNAVWSAINRTLTEFPDVVNETDIAKTVWEYTIRNLTYYESIDDVDYERIYQGVWNATDRNLTYYENVEINYTLISESVWDYINRTLTEFDFTVDINESLVADSVWSAINRTLTDFDFTVDIDNNEIADAVWNATVRTLTDYNQSAQVDLTDYNRIQQLVWNATIRNLTYYETTDIDYNQIQDMVWNATIRTLTDFNFSVAINESIIADAVWDAVNRTLTDYNQTDLTDYNLIQTMIWNATTRTLTGFSFTVDIDESDIWNYVSRNLTYYETADVSNLSVSINNSAVADAVWNYNGTINSNILNQVANKIQCYIATLFEDEEEWGVEIKTC